MTFLFTRPTKLGLAMSALLSLLAGTSAQAEDIQLSSATASLSNLRFMVIDLDPTDGIAASAVFKTGGVLFGQPLYPEPTSLVATFDFNAQPIPASTVVMTEGVFSSSSSGITLTSAMKASEMKPAIPEPLGDFSLGGHNLTFGTVGYLPYEPLPPVDQGTTAVTLGANTALVISGDAAVAASGVLTWSGASSLVSPALAGAAVFSSNARALISMNLTTPLVYIDAQGNEVLMDTWASDEFKLSASFSSYDGVAQQKTSPFSISLRNELPVSVNENFDLKLEVGDGAKVLAYNNIPQVPSIPEPGTYALMGLGLAGIALARQRARR
jgi:hypothetical protein